MILNIIVGFSSIMNCKELLMDSHLRMTCAWGEKSTLAIFQKACGLIEFGVFQFSISPSAECPLTLIYRTWDTPLRQECHAGQLFLKEDEGKNCALGSYGVFHLIKFYAF